MGDRILWPHSSHYSYWLVSSKNIISRGKRPSRRFSIWRSLTDHCVEANLPGLREVVFHNSRSVDITGQRSFNKPEAPLSSHLEDRFQKMQSAQKTNDRPLFRTNVQPKCPNGRLRFVQNTSKPAPQYLTLMGNGSIEIFPYQQFNFPY